MLRPPRAGHRCFFDPLVSLFQFSHTPAIKMTSCFVNRGNTGTAHAASTTGFAPDNWNSLRDANLLGPGWRCYDPAKDLVVPPWNEAAKVGAGKSPTAEQYPHHLTVTLPYSNTRSPPNANQSPTDHHYVRAGGDSVDPTHAWIKGARPNLFFFAGDLGTAAGIPDSGPHGNPAYSMGIRQVERAFSFRVSHRRGN